MKHILIAAIAATAIAYAGSAIAEGGSDAKLQKVISSSWKEPNKNNPEGANPDWASRLTQDPLQQACTQARNTPDKDLAAQIQAAAKASIKYPDDGKLLGDWKNGEKIAQNGKG